MLFKEKVLSLFDWHIVHGFTFGILNSAKNLHSNMGVGSWFHKGFLWVVGLLIMGRKISEMGKGEELSYGVVVQSGVGLQCELRGEFSTLGLLIGDKSSLAVPAEYELVDPATQPGRLSYESPHHSSARPWIYSKKAVWNWTWKLLSGFPILLGKAFERCSIIRSMGFVRRLGEVDHYGLGAKNECEPVEL